MKRDESYSAFIVAIIGIVLVVGGVLLLSNYNAGFGQAVSVCGNGNVEPGEQCDDGNTINGDGCSRCMIDSIGLPVAIDTECGNGVLDAGEECDDSNNLDSDGCSADCFIEYAQLNPGPVITVISPTQGQVLPQNVLYDITATSSSGIAICKASTDNGPDQIMAQMNQDRWIFQITLRDGGHLVTFTCIDTNGDFSSETISFLVSSSPPVCGNRVVDVGEDCDDGNLNNNDGCSSSCIIEQCGDGIRQTSEDCDDGNLDNTDSCLNTCETAKCRDGFLHIGVEECDDGNKADGDGCTVDCLLENYICGNGILEPGEDCDDGNTVSRDGCSSTCQSETLVPGIGIDVGECGDGVLDSSEECDDGNTANGDGCSSVCETETPQVCQPNEVVCASSLATQQCVSDGSGYEVPVPCPPAEACVSGVCQPQPVQIQGTGITITVYPEDNNLFKTEILANQDFSGTDITVYTILYDSAGRVLSLTSEKIVGGLAANAIYTSLINYPQANVVSKSVIVFDKEQSPTVYANYP